MKTYTKTVRFYDTKKDKKALEALSRYADYGFSNANDMIVSALYEFTERNNTTTELDINALADMIAKRLSEKDIFLQGTSEAFPSITVPSGPETLCSTDAELDNNIADIMSDILSY